MRGNELIAYVSPASLVAGYPVSQLDRLFADLPHLSIEESRNFLDDIHQGDNLLQAESDAWAS